MAYAAEQLVEHDHYGLGKILSVEGDRILIHFKQDRTARKMSARQSPLKLSTIEHDPYFDGIKAVAAARPRTASGTSRTTVRKPRATGKYPTQQNAVAGFLKIFPLGFNDPKYLADDAAGERSYKVKAHELWKETLNKQEFERLVAEGRYGEAVQRAENVESSVNLLHPQFERAALWGAVREPQAAEAFSRGLFDLIYGDDAFEVRFDRYAAMLTQLPHSKASILKWPTATIFPFLALPSEHLFLRPGATQMAAKRLAFTLNYQTTPSWSPYSSVMNLGRLLMTELADLGPRDMIDVQSFIFVTGQANYPGS